LSQKNIPTVVILSRLGVRIQDCALPVPYKFFINDFYLIILDPDALLRMTE